MRRVHMVTFSTLLSIIFIFIPPGSPFDLVGLSYYEWELIWYLLNLIPFGCFDPEQRQYQLKGNSREFKMTPTRLEGERKGLKKSFNFWKILGKALTPKQRMNQLTLKNCLVWTELDIIDVKARLMLLSVSLSCLFMF